MLLLYIFTACHRSSAKVMFSVVYVRHSVHRGCPHVTTTNDTIGQSQVTPRFGLVHLGLQNPLLPGGPPSTQPLPPPGYLNFFHWGPPPPPHLSKLVYYISQTCWQTGG